MSTVSISVDWYKLNLSETFSKLHTNSALCLYKNGSCVILNEWREMVNSFRTPIRKTTLINTKITKTYH